MKNHWFKSIIRIPIFVLASPIYVINTFIIFAEWVSVDGLTWKGAIKRWERY